MNYTISIEKEDIELLSKAITEYRNKNYQSSENALLNLQKKYLNHPEIIIYLAKIKFHFYKNNQETKLLLEHCLKIHPKHAEAWLVYGNIEYKLENYSNACKYYRKTLAIDSQNPAALNNLANCLALSNNPLEAIVILNQLLKLFPKHYSGWHNLGSLYHRVHKLDEAIGCFEKIIEANVDDDDTWFNYGAALDAKQQNNKALAAYNRALTINPAHAQCAHNVAVHYHRQHKYEDALTFYKKAYKLNNDNTTAKFFIEVLQEDDLSDASPPIEHIQALFDQYAYNYDQHLQKTLEYSAPLKARELLFRTVPDIKTGRVLDLGCGTGLSGPVFRDIAEFLLGIDISENMLQIAKQKKIYDNLICSSIENFIKNSRKKYDLIIMLDVICYIINIEEILFSIKKLLSKSGFIIFNFEKPVKNIDKYLNKSGRVQFSNEYIINILKKVNLNVLIIEEMYLRIKEPGYCGHYLIIAN